MSNQKKISLLREALEFIKKDGSSLLSPIANNVIESALEITEKQEVDNEDCH